MKKFLVLSSMLICCAFLFAPLAYGVGGWGDPSVDGTYSLMILILLIGLTITALISGTKALPVRMERPPAALSRRRLMVYQSSV